VEAPRICWIRTGHRLGQIPTDTDFTMAIDRIKLTRIAHVYYKHEKVEEAKQFMRDFGFEEGDTIGKTTYFRGYGTEPFVIAIEAADKTEFGGAAFAVESEEELVRAAEILPKEANPTAVYELKTPGGGKGVTFYDPVDGFPFHLVYGQSTVEPRDPKFPVLRVNYVSVQSTLGFVSDG